MEKKKEEQERKFDGILDYGIIKNHKVQGFTDEQNKQVIRTTSNFEKAHLKAYLQGYKYFRFHGKLYEVKYK
jgi:histidinol phosphatase-like PHP family hydrolase